jgi:DNA repair protein RecN (Recombination protein N)
MLTSLFIRDFAIVPRLELALEPGLTVLTGETGAGKSILVDALMLALGARADSDHIRQDAESTEVTAGFDLPARHPAAAWLGEHELRDDDACVVRRLVYRSRPTKAFINGRAVTMQSLREFGDRVVDIYGQHEHQSLLRRESQRQIVDDYAGVSDVIMELGRLYQEHKALQSRLSALTTESSARLHEIDLLRFQTGELHEAALQTGEFAELEQEHARLAHASELRQGIEACSEALSEAEDKAATQIIAHCIGQLEALLEYEPRLTGVVNFLNQAAIEIDEASNELRQLSDRVDLDPGRLVEVETRMRTLLDLARKHQCEPGQLVEVHQQLADKLADLEDTGVSVEQLERSIAESRDRYAATADIASERRRQAASRLADEVTKHMQELGMKGGRFDILVTTRDRNEPTRFGFDDIEFQVSANPGQPLRPLTKVASGGELSRISLAIQVVAAAVGRVPTLIFDEVDVGIGGRVAEIVGKKLRALGEARQVLCITHLAQVAAQGTHHLHVQKHDRKGVRVSIDGLDDEQRVQEIARMLGGLKITDQTLAHAESMLDRVAM